MECKERKLEMVSAEIVQKFNDLESEIVASMKVASEMEDKMRRKERECCDLQSQVTLKNLFINRLGAELTSAARDLARRMEENTKLRTKIRDLEDQLQYYRKTNDKIKRDTRPVKCITQTLERRGICHSYQDYDAKPRHDSTSDRAMSVESSTTIDRTTSPFVHLQSDHISYNPNGVQRAQLRVEETCENMHINRSFAGGRVKYYTTEESAVSSTTVPSNRNAIRPRTAPYSHWWKTTKRWLVKLMNRKQNDVTAVRE
ncbi:uncharacterized protein LOC110832118 isoform X2 [Zootermopsis nevadensis]|uniref:uncharacterized protein LOC110832118 isoform X2 n=1 Tax=Zootermopsis nevadensis TaxID=136037 RepID=UPI000B8EC31F|nr:uncharacterized protein LOC110832118 isoform X2 [Zootermopsis nevadensis]